MLLALDVGNSHIHVGIFYNNELILQFRYTTSVLCNSSSDQISFFLQQSLNANSINLYSIEAVAIASVVPVIDCSLRSAISKCFCFEPFFLQSDVNIELKMKDDILKNIGIDRLAACLAAVDMFPKKNILVIDLGTATVFDAVDRNKFYLGGAIFPGVQISLEALISKTAKLTSVNIIKPKVVIGENTTVNLQSGIYYGHLGALKEIKSAMINEIKSVMISSSKDSREVMTIATGGFSRLFDEPNLFDKIIPDLILQGIRIAFNKNN